MVPHAKVCIGRCKRSAHCSILKKKDDILPFISTYNPNNPNVFPKVREIYRNLQTSKTLIKIFAKHKLIDCKMQPPNLKRLLCSLNKPTFKTTKCGKSCFRCDYIIEAELFLNLRIGTNHLF